VGLRGELSCEINLSSGFSTSFGKADRSIWLMLAVGGRTARSSQQAWVNLTQALWVILTRRWVVLTHAKSARNSPRTAVKIFFSAQLFMAALFTRQDSSALALLA
jgi:hypothetical protein